MASATSDNEDARCGECDNKPCLFERFTREFVCTDAWQAEKEDIESQAGDEDVNRALRKRLYRNFVYWNGALTKARTRLPVCVESGVRSLYKSDAYIGFKRTHEEIDNTALDIDGKKVPGAKWVRDDDGHYNLQVDGKVQKMVLDMQWQKRGP